jgi:hypothetical protein
MASVDRKNKRIAVYWKSKVQTPEGKIIIGKTKNVSLSGFMIEINDFVNVGDILTIETLAVFKGDTHKIISKCVVTYWTLIPNGMYDIGVKFLSMTPSGKDFIERFILEKLE